MPRRATARQRLLLLVLASTALCAVPGQVLAQNVEGLRGTVADASVLTPIVGDDTNLMALPNGERAETSAPLSGGGLAPVPGDRPTDLFGNEIPEDPSYIPPSRQGPVFAEEPEDPTQPVDFGALPADPAEEETADPEETERNGGRARALDPLDPLQAGPEITREDDPFAAVGLRLGTFIVRPSLELGVTKSQSTSFTTTGTPPVISESDENGTFSDVAVRVLAESDWSRHALEIDAVGRYQKSLSGDQEAQPEAEVTATGRIDVSATTQIIGELGYRYQLEDTKAPDALSIIDDPLALETAGGVTTPSEQSIRSSATIAHKAGPFFGELGVAAERTIFGDVQFGDGSAIEQSDQDNTFYNFRIRGGIDTQAVFSPFVEVAYGLRRRDQAVDGNGYNRNSARYDLRLGTLVDLGEKLNGEISAGYIVEKLNDETLEDIKGISLQSALQWSPRRETQIGLELETETQSSGLADVSGSVVYGGLLSLDQRLRHNLTMRATIGVEHEAFTGLAWDKTTVTGELSGTYWYNRYMGLTGRVGASRVFSGDASQEETSQSVFLGLRLQR